ncbi:hypothetical protein B0H13DRAFT_655419 [Mycena leptocephala]|nr:hypothetical protein B0H13DRAFT_655419 [Mycena leptocephala]
MRVRVSRGGEGRVKSQEYILGLATHARCNVWMDSRYSPSVSTNERFVPLSMALEHPRTAHLMLSISLSSAPFDYMPPPSGCVCMLRYSSSRRVGPHGRCGRPPTVFALPRAPSAGYARDGLPSSSTLSQTLSVERLRLTDSESSAMSTVAPALMTPPLTRLRSVVLIDNLRSHAAKLMRLAVYTSSVSPTLPGVGYSLSRSCRRARRAYPTLLSSRAARICESCGTARAMRRSRLGGRRRCMSALPAGARHGSARLYVFLTALRKLERAALVGEWRWR